MPLFHKHDFKPTKIDHQYICYCGKVKCLHFYKLMDIVEAIEDDGDIIYRTKKAVLQCIYCGTIKSQTI